VLDVAQWGRWMVPIVLAQYRWKGVAGPAATSRATTDLAHRLERDLAPG
jgi:hypothetical protein